MRLLLLIIMIIIITILIMLKALLSPSTFPARRPSVLASRGTERAASSERPESKSPSDRCRRVPSQSDADLDVVLY